MKIQVLGCCQGKLPGYYTTAFLLNDHVLDIWFHENDQVRCLQIGNINEERQILDVSFFPDGILEKIGRRVPNGFIHIVYSYSGDIKMKDHYIDNSDIYVRERYENGVLKESEELKIPQGMNF